MRHEGIGGGCLLLQTLIRVGHVVGHARVGGHAHRTEVVGWETGIIMIKRFQKGGLAMTYLYVSAMECIGCGGAIEW